MIALLDASIASGIARAIFSHFGKGPIEMGEPALKEALTELAAEKAPRSAVSSVQQEARARFMFRARTILNFPAVQKSRFERAHQADSAPLGFAMILS